MKTILLASVYLLSLKMMAQTTITSITNGNATNPFTWDCTCFPTFNDDVIINHDVTLDTDWIVNTGGSITVNSSGSFIEDGNYRSILVDGSGSEIENSGIMELTNLGSTNGALVTNNGTFDLDSGLYVGISTTFLNNGIVIGLDSLVVEGVMNSTGSLNIGDILNTGDINTSGTLTCDSLYNTGVINITDDFIECSDFGSIGSLLIANNGYMIVQNGFYNAGFAGVYDGRYITVGSDFLNSDTLGGTAYIDNYGLIEVSGNFYNTDTLGGIGGVFCIADSSYNTGEVIGTLDICDNSGTGYFDFNTGSIGSTVTDCISGCAVAINEHNTEILNVYPNPVQDKVNLGQLFAVVKIFNASGKLIMELTNASAFSAMNLLSGLYVISAMDDRGIIQTSKFIK